MVIKKGYENNQDIYTQNTIFENIPSEEEFERIKKSLEKIGCIMSNGQYDRNNFKLIYYATYDDGDILIFPESSLESVVSKSEGMLSSKAGEDFRNIIYDFENN